jgi:hypothetical protein
LTFKIQIPTDVIRNKKLSHEAFFVYGKLLQHYYINKGKSTILSIDHRKFMYFANIKSNKTFKKCMSELFLNELIKCDVITLPRQGNIEIELVDVKGKKDYPFAQLEYWFLDQYILDVIHYEGFRLLYYFKSYINDYKEFCFCSRERIAEDIGSSPNTVDKYCGILEKLKLIKIDKHVLKSDGSYLGEFDDRENFTKYNNHYYLRVDQFEKLHHKLKKDN